MASKLKIVEVTDGRSTKKVALYSGINVSELTDLLQTVFGSSESILGFQSNVCLPIFAEFVSLLFNLYRMV